MPPRSRRAGALPPPTRSEAAFLRLLAETKGGARATGDAVIDELFSKAKEFAERDRYATIGDATSFNTKVVGVSFDGRQDVLGGLRAGDPLALVRQPDNVRRPQRNRRDAAEPCTSASSQADGAKTRAEVRRGLALSGRGDGSDRRRRSQRAASTSGSTASLKPAAGARPRLERSAGEDDVRRALHRRSHGARFATRSARAARPRGRARSPSGDRAREIVLLSVPRCGPRACVRPKDARRLSSPGARQRPARRA